jgi:hypothetical protein
MMHYIGVVTNTRIQTMTHYILIVIFFGNLHMGSRPVESTMSVEFNSSATCNAAGEHVFGPKKSLPDTLWECVAK